MKPAVGLTILALALIPFEVQARCHGGYADKQIKEKYKEACMVDAAAEVPGFSDAVTGICMDGCYSAMFLGGTPECDKLYGDAVAKYKKELDAVAAKPNCGMPKGGEQETARGPEKSCKWMHRQTIEVKCGGSNKANICNAAGRGMCSGTAYCQEGFDLAGSAYDRGAYEVTCLTKTGSCVGEGAPSMSECFNDPNTFVNTEESQFSSPIRRALESGAVQ